MAVMIVPEMLKCRLAEAEGAVEFRAEDGTVLGHFTPASTSPESARAAARVAAFERFKELALNSTFRSQGPYPSRDELHERS